MAGYARSWPCIAEPGLHGRAPTTTARYVAWDMYDIMYDMYVYVKDIYVRNDVTAQLQCEGESSGSGSGRRARGKSKEHRQGKGTRQGHTTLMRKAWPSECGKIGEMLAYPHVPSAPPNRIANLSILVVCNNRRDAMNWRLSMASVLP